MDNLNQPAVSASGFPTIDVDEHALAAMIGEFNRKGMTIHSYEGATIWAVTTYCQSKKLPYEVMAIKNTAGKLKAFSVNNKSVWKNEELPEGWTSESIENWQPEGFKKSDKPIMNK